MAVCCIGILGTMALCLREYRRSAFIHLSVFCGMMAAENPEAEEMVLSCVKQYRDGVAPDSGFLEQYGYQVQDFDSGLPVNVVMAGMIMTSMSFLGFCLIRLWSYRYKRGRIAELTACLERINAGSESTVLGVKEDEFSHLQDEICKTVTELYRTREQAVAAKTNYADNLANVAHQLKTPVTAAMLTVQLMEEAEGRGAGAEARKDYIGRIKKQLERLRCLEESLLTLSRVDAGTLRLEDAEVDCYTVLNLAADHVQDLFEAKEVTVEIPDDGCVTFRGDLEWSMEALINLFKNCMEHSPRGGVVHCSYAVNLLYVEIRIWDEGTGFAHEDFPHLFERFYTGGGNGIGIGLPLASSIFALQNGTVTADNMPQGGACFEIRIYSH